MTDDAPQRQEHIAESIARMLIAGVATVIVVVEVWHAIRARSGAGGSPGWEDFRTLMESSRSTFDWWETTAWALLGLACYLPWLVGEAKFLAPTSLVRIVGAWLLAAGLAFVEVFATIEGDVSIRELVTSRFFFHRAVSWLPGGILLLFLWGHRKRFARGSQGQTEKQQQG